MQFGQESFHDLEEEFHHHPVEKPRNFLEKTKSTMPISREDLEALCEGDPMLESLHKEMVLCCVRYARDAFLLDRLQITPASERDSAWREEYERTDKIRKQLHDTVVDNINILGRNLKEHGKTNEWLRPLAQVGRPAYGLFAIDLALDYYLSLEAQEATHA
jgi:hypothetical protein